MASMAFVSTLPSKPFSPSIRHLKMRSNGVSLSRFNGFHSPSPLTNSLRTVFPTNQRKRETIVCAYPALNVQTLQWVSAVSTGVLMFAKGTAINKSFLAPLFALQAPASVIAWIKGEYGMWTAFLALLVRLFYFVPGKLELPFLTMLLVIAAPHQLMHLRGTQGGAIISLAIAAYLAFQHFSRAGGFRNSFVEGSIMATFSVICISVVPFFFLF